MSPEDLVEYFYGEESVGAYLFGALHGVRLLDANALELWYVKAMADKLEERLETLLSGEATDDQRCRIGYMVNHYASGGGDMDYLQSLKGIPALEKHHDNLEALYQCMASIARNAYEQQRLARKVEQRTILGPHLPIPRALSEGDVPQIDFIRLIAHPRGLLSLEPSTIRTFVNVVVFGPLYELWLIPEEVKC